MKVLHLIKATRLSGAERHLLILLPALRQRGVDARLVLMVEPDKPMDNIMQACAETDIPVQRLTVKRGVDVRVIPQLRALLRAERPDILHTHLIHADVLGMIAGQLAGIRHIVTTRHNDDDFRHRRLIQWVNRWNWRGVTQGIAISQAIQHFVVTVEHAPAQKVRVIPYGLRHQRLAPTDIDVSRRGLRQQLGLAEDTLLVGIMARLTEQKGIVYALEAFKLVLQDFPTAHLVVGGDGELKEALMARTDALNIRSHVHFLGWREDAPTVMQALDVFLLPSLWEGFGLVLLEAMSARLPIVASHVSAIPEIVLHGETGYLVEPKDHVAIAYALRLLLADKLMRQYMGFNGEDRLENEFSVEKMANQTLAVYEGVSHSSNPSKIV